MSDTGPDPRTAPMIEARRRVSRTKVRHVEEAIKHLVRAGKQVTVSAVADQAGVSRGWLSRHPDLGPQVRALRSPRAPGVPAPAADGAAPSPVSALREHLRREQQRHAHELTEARARITDLERQLAMALGEIIRLRDDTTA